MTPGLTRQLPPREPRSASFIPLFCSSSLPAFTGRLPTSLTAPSVHQVPRDWTRAFAGRAPLLGSRRATAPGIRKDSGMAGRARAVTRWKQTRNFHKPRQASSPSQNLRWTSLPGSSVRARPRCCPQGSRREPETLLDGAAQPLRCRAVARRALSSRPRPESVSAEHWA